MRLKSGKRKRGKIVKSIFFAVCSLVWLAGVPIAAAQSEDANFTLSDQELVTDGSMDTGEQTFPPKEVLEGVSEKKTGSIHVVLTDGKNGTSKAGIRFQCIRVADVINGEYVLVDIYEDSKVALNEIENSGSLDAAAKKFAEYQAADQFVETNENGEMTISDLSVGVYLLKAEDCDTYDTISPALIAIPTWNEQEGEMQYDVSIEPKHTPKPEKERNTAPQTGLEEHTVKYLAAAGMCLVGAFGLAVLIGGKEERK